MKSNDDLPTTNTTEIKQLINRVKQGKLDQGDAQLIEKLLNIPLTIVSLLQQKHASIRRMKELLFGIKEKKLGKSESIKPWFLLLTAHSKRWKSSGHGAQIRNHWWRGSEELSARVEKVLSIRR